MRESGKEIGGISNFKFQRLNFVFRVWGFREGRGEPVSKIIILIFNTCLDF